MLTLKRAAITFTHVLCACIIIMNTSTLYSTRTTYKIDYNDSGRTLAVDRYLATPPRQKLCNHRVWRV